MHFISKPTATAPAARARSAAYSSPASQVGRLPSQRRIAPSVAGEVGNRLATTKMGTPIHASSAPKKRPISMLRAVTGCTLGAVVGAVIGGPIGIVVGAAVGSAYVIIGPRAIAQSIQKAALVAYQHIQHYCASRKPANTPALRAQQ